MYTSRHFAGRYLSQSSVASHRVVHQARAASIITRASNQGPHQRHKIREFVVSECPVAGFDGRFRERHRESTAEAVLICSVEDWDPSASSSSSLGGSTAELILVPGCQSIIRVSEAQLDQVIRDQGQVLLSAIRPHETGTPVLPLVPANGGGSYASLAQTFGVQRIEEGKGAFIRVISQQRVVIQAVQGISPSEARAQAAVLPDRWSYYVRSQVVEAVLEAAISVGVAKGLRVSQETLDLGRQPADVRSSIVSLQDVAQQLQMELLEIRESVQALQRRRVQQQKGIGGDGVEDEVLDELSGIVEFVHQRGGGPDPVAPAAAERNADALVAGSVAGGGGGGGDVLHFSALERLSFAAFAAERLAAFAGIPMADLAVQRRQALQVCDLGLRLEQAFDFISGLAARLGTRLALEGAQLD